MNNDEIRISLCRCNSYHLLVCVFFLYSETMIWYLLLLSKVLQTLCMCMLVKYICLHCTHNCTQSHVNINIYSACILQWGARAPRTNTQPPLNDQKWLWSVCLQSAGQRKKPSPLFVTVITLDHILREESYVSMVHAQCQQFDGTNEQCTVVRAVYGNCLSPLPVCFIFIMSFSFPWNLWHIHQQCDKLDVQWNGVWLRAVED